LIRLDEKRKKYQLERIRQNILFVCLGGWEVSFSSRFYRRKKTTGRTHVLRFSLITTPPPAPSLQAMASWTCVDCTYTNERAAAFCGMCASGRPSISHAPIDLRSPASAERKNDASTNKRKAPSIAAALAEQQEEDDSEAGDELLPAQAPEERRGTNPFSSFVYNDDDDDTTVSTAAPLRAFSHAPPTTAKRHLSKLLSGGGGGADDAPKKRSRKQQQPCGERAPEDFDKESEDIKEATVLKWRRILGPVAKRTWTGNTNNNQAGGGGEGGEGVEAGSAATDPSAATDDDPTNLYRFRLLVAVILSSRTQEQIVRQAIDKIAQCYPGPQFSPRYFASSIESWETLSERLSFVHCNKVKSRHILQTANIIEKEFRGKVPRRREGLLKMAGIGPTLAPLLEFLFARHEEEQEQKEGMEGKEGEEEQQEGRKEGEAQVVEQQEKQHGQDERQEQQEQQQQQQKEPSPVRQKKREEEKQEEEEDDDDEEIVIVGN